MVTFSYNVPVMAIANGVCAVSFIEYMSCCGEGVGVYGPASTFEVVPTQTIFSVVGTVTQTSILESTTSQNLAVDDLFIEEPLLTLDISINDHGQQHGHFQSRPIDFLFCLHDRYSNLDGKNNLQNYYNFDYNPSSKNNQ